MSDPAVHLTETRTDMATEYKLVAHFDNGTSFQVYPEYVKFDSWLEAERTKIAVLKLYKTMVANEEMISMPEIEIVQKDVKKE